VIGRIVLVWWPLFAAALERPAAPAREWYLLRAFGVSCLLLSLFCFCRDLVPEEEQLE
jgi:hypothetical protein